MARAQQRGSVIGFIVVGIALVAVVLGGLYFAQNRLAGNLDAEESDQAKLADSDEPKTDEQTQNNSGEPKDSDADKQEKAALEAKRAEEEKVNQKSQEQREADAAAVKDRAAKQKAAQQKRQAEDESKSQSSSDQSANSKSTPTTGVAAAENIPETGPADAFVAVFGVAALLGAVLAYRRSNIL